MRELIIEQIEFAISDNEPINAEAIAEFLYNEDMNFKHCDPTTQQRCYDYTELHLMVEEEILNLEKSEYVKEKINGDVENGNN